MTGKAESGRERVVLCGSNAYEQKYYFNQDFDALPKTVKEELRIICVLFTEEVGGVFTMVFEEDGTLSLEVMADEGDVLYDEIGSGLLIREIQKRRRELMESLTYFYKIFILKEDMNKVIGE